MLHNPYAGDTTGSGISSFVSCSPANVANAAVKSSIIFNHLRPASLRPAASPTVLTLVSQRAFQSECSEYGAGRCIRSAPSAQQSQNRLSRLALHAGGLDSDGAELESCGLCEQGVEWHKAVFTKDETDQLNAIIDCAIEASDQAICNWRGNAHLDKKIPNIAWLAKDPRILSLLVDHISGTPTLIRFALMDKPAGKRWPVLWHQDNPANETLEERVVTVRIHLDRADRNNGCLKVILGTHKDGVMSRAVLNQTVMSSEPLYCQVEAGDVLLMRPLVVHSSEDNLDSKNRRVLHLEYVDLEASTAFSDV